MLSEAPGYPADIAVALGLEESLIADALEDLSHREILTSCEGRFGTWYQITPVNFRDALTAGLNHSPAQRAASTSTGPPILDDA